MVEMSYECECCGNEFTSKRTRHGEKLCVNCIKIRRNLKPFIEKRGLTVGQVLARAGWLLLPHAEKKPK